MYMHREKTIVLGLIFVCVVSLKCVSLVVMSLLEMGWCLHQWQLVTL